MVQGDLRARERWRLARCWGDVWKEGVIRPNEGIKQSDFHESESQLNVLLLEDGICLQNMTFAEIVFVFSIQQQGWRLKGAEIKRKG